MVFCGKPSKGCATCRAKKKKCDEAFPACSLCRRTGTRCPGYRDQLSLSFRDESQHVLRKVRGSTGKKTCSINEPIQQPKAFPALDFTHGRRGSDSQSLEYFGARRGSCASAFKYDGFSSAFSLSNFDHSPNAECSSPMPKLPPARELIPNLHDDIYRFHLSPSLEDQATCFFFHNYVFTELASPYDHFACLPILYSQAREMKALSGIMMSIGAAGISNISKDPDLMRAAQEIYSSTLQHTQSLLADSSQIQKDQTLLTVLLLALYENITCFAPQSMRSWSRHVRGATALLALRGQDALNDEAFLELYLHLRQQIITDCLQRRVSVPQIVIYWSQKVKKVISEQKLWENCLEEDISIRLCQLRSSIKQGIVDGDEAIRQAISINEALERWLSNVPAEFSYTKIYDFESPENVFFGCYHIYSKTRVAFVWNHYRSLRILTNEIIIDALYSSGGVSSREAQRLASEQLFKKLTADICRSVPPFLGYQNSQKCAPVMIGTLLLWPLYTCAAQTFVSPRTREWIILQLDRIGETMGIQLATSLAQLLRNRREVTVWDRIDADNARNPPQVEVEWENYEEW